MKIEHVFNFKNNNFVFRVKIIIANIEFLNVVKFVIHVEISQINPRSESRKQSSKILLKFI